MKLQVLIDNNTYIDRYFQAEPGLSFFLEEGESRILFDLGYSNLFLENAQRMDIDLRKLDYLVLSHGHLDHTWGMNDLLRFYLESTIEGVPLQKPTLVSHPDTFLSRGVGPLAEIGAVINEETTARHFKMQLSTKPVWLTEQLLFLGEIPRNNDFEAQQGMGSLSDGAPDFIMEDSALAYKGKDGLVLIVGCSHAGICNTVEHARRVCQEDRVIDIIGGLHLLDSPKATLEATVDYLAKLNLKSLNACHCTDLKAKIALAQRTPLQEVGIGLALEWD